MKYLFILLLFVLSCSNAPIVVTPTPEPVDEVQQAFNELEDMYDGFSLFESGENAFTRKGREIFAKGRQGKLTDRHCLDYLSALERVKVPGGMQRTPNNTDWQSRDDYLSSGSGLGECMKHASPDIAREAKEMLEYIYQNKKLAPITIGGIHEKGTPIAIWSPHHDNFFLRLLGRFNPGAASDDTLRASAQGICTKPEGETSYKLLLAFILLAAREVSPTYFSVQADKFCRARVDMNQVVDIYYQEAPHWPRSNKQMRIILRGLL